MGGNIHPVFIALRHIFVFVCVCVWCVSACVSEAEMAFRILLAQAISRHIERDAQGICLKEIQTEGSGVCCGIFPSRMYLWLFRLDVVASVLRLFHTCSCVSLTEFKHCRSHVA